MIVECLECDKEFESIDTFQICPDCYMANWNEKIFDMELIHPDWGDRDEN